MTPDLLALAAAVVAKAAAVNTLVPYTAKITFTLIVRGTAAGTLVSFTYRTGSCLALP